MAEQLDLFVSARPARVSEAGRGLLHNRHGYVYEILVWPGTAEYGARYAMGRGNSPEAAQRQAEEIARMLRERGLECGQTPQSDSASTTDAATPSTAPTST